jgi:MFS-type transporter involved in bile tolerance (Atg22 family)
MQPLHHYQAIPLVESNDTSASHVDSTNPANGVFHCIERGFRIRLNGESTVPVATAQVMDASAKGMLHVSSVFFGPALLQLAKNKSKDSWLVTSSLLTTTSMVATLSAALCLPWIGPFLDASPHRRAAGAITAMALVVINFFQIFLSEKYLVLFIISHALSDALNILHYMIVLAYLQSMTTHVTLLSQYSSRFAIRQHSWMAGLLILITLYAHATHATVVTTSRVAHIVSSLLGAVVMYHAWTFLFPECPPRDSSLTDVRAGWEASLSQIRNATPALRWFMMTLLWSPSVGSGSYLAMMSTLQKSLMHMTPTQMGITNICTLLATLPGAAVAPWVAHHGNPLLSFRLSLVSFAMAISLTVFFVRGPDQIILYMISNTLIGFSLGWQLPTERVLYCTLTPLGHEARSMSLLLCVHLSTAWVPPMLFSLVTQAGYPLTWALGSQLFLLALALLSSSRIGSFEQAVRQARNQCSNNHSTGTAISE